MKKKKINLKVKKKGESRGWLKNLMTIFFVLALFIFAYASFYFIYFEGKFYPGFKMGEISLQGKTYQEVNELINNYTKEVAENGLRYQFDQEEVAVFPVFSSAEGTDLVYEILNFNEEETINQIYEYGRFGPVWENFIEQVSALINGVEVVIAYELDEAELEKILRENFSEYETPAEDAHLSLNEESQFEIVAEKEGLIFNYKNIIAQDKKKIENLNNSLSAINLIKDYPEVKEKNTTAAFSRIEEVLDYFPVTFLYKEKSWEINRDIARTWLDFDIRNGQTTLGLNNQFTAYLEENIASEINQEVREGKFEVKDSKVSEFQASQSGMAVNIDTTREKIEQEVIDDQKKEVVLIVDVVNPVVTTESINELGVKELVGRGESNFYRSPANRRHNIRVGAETLHGLLIKPDEEFSLVKALGSIEAATGYLPELVIKGNKTVPEYGGGLCQIGTTAFRVALDAGVPITERKPHSYRVSYYEPAGTDATIYDPSPDFKFINDTGHYILLQTKIEGNDLIFEFYGTSDGRIVEMTKPTLFNYVSPPSTKYVESEDLAPGQTKCTERAHTGATAVFYRTITPLEGEPVKETWSSVYKPWQEVCLVGVE